MQQQFKLKKIKAIIGLGNPGKEYENTYHNLGFLFIDYLIKSQLLNYSITQLLKSGVYMNQSGDFVLKTAKKYKSKPEEIIIVHDDSDIELGKYKLSFGGGAAGHRGIESIIKALKTSAEGGSASGGKNFWRIRIGIREIKLNEATGRKNRRVKAGEWVLKKIKPQHQKILNQVFEEAAAELKL